MTTSRLQPKQLDRAFAVVREGIERGEAGPSVMAVANGREIIRQEVIPAPDDDIQVHLDSIFLLASITKPFIGTAFMQLAEQGRLLISDPVTRYVPEFGRFGKEEVTIWHLLTHTSGLSEEVWEPLWEERVPASAYLEAACNGFLHFQPGTRWEYCNISFWVLAEIITRVSGEPYVEYLRHSILEPLGMADTAFDFDGPQAERMVPIHSVQPLPGGDDIWPYFRSLALPAGGLYSTAADLVKFGQAMLNGLAGRERTIVSQAGIATMTRLHTEGIRERSTGRPAWYGLGWGKPGGDARTLGTPAAFGHGGATATLLWIEPDHDLVFVFLTNQWGQEVRLAYMALNAILGSL
ncbi:MAG: beta-lactamase family protein [Chloroflexi bacterium]|nr:beta-lactamase family protein [Chloroflexota bacterium]